MSNVREEVAESAECIAAYGRHLANSFGGRVERWSGIDLCDAGLAWRSRNTAVLLNPIDSGTQRRLAERIVDFYGSRDRWGLVERFSS